MNTNKMKNPQWNTQRKNNVSILHKMLSMFCLIPRSPRPQITRQKHYWMTNMIQVQVKNQPNQCCHLINHTHFSQNSGLIINKHP